MKKIVIITVEGGVVQDVEVPDGVQVVVKDYDVDGSEEDLSEDENGDEFIEKHLGVIVMPQTYRGTCFWCGKNFRQGFTAHPAKEQTLHDFGSGDGCRERA